MDSAAAFCPAIIVPFVTAHDLADTVLDWFLFPIVIKNTESDFCADHFQNFYVFRAALAPRGMAALCGIANDEFHEHAITAFLPSPNWPVRWQDGALCQGDFCADSPAEIGPPEIGPAEIGLAEIGPPEIGPPEIGPAEIGPPEIGPPEIGLAEIGPATLFTIAEPCGVEVKNLF